MIKRHGCLQSYILYVLLFVVYFILLGFILRAFFPNITSERALPWYLFCSAALSLITIIVIYQRDKIKKIINHRAASGDTINHNKTGKD